MAARQPAFLLAELSFGAPVSYSEKPDTFLHQSSLGGNRGALGGWCPLTLPRAAYCSAVLALAATVRALCELWEPAHSPGDSLPLEMSLGSHLGCCRGQERC